MTQKKKPNIIVLNRLILMLLIGFLASTVLACKVNNPSNTGTKPPPPQITQENLNKQPNLASEELLKAGPLGLIPADRRKEAPLFELPFVIGGDFSLSDYKGKLVLLDFTATWCHWCDRQAPQVEAVYKKFKGKGLDVFAINCREPKETVLAKYPNGTKAYSIVLDEQGTVFSMYSPVFDMRGYPTYILLDKDGKAAYIQSGYNEDFELIVSDLVNYLLKN